MERKTRGAWILHHTNKLETVTGSGDFESIETAGKAGVLLSALSASETSTLTESQVISVAKGARIKIKLELPQLLDMLERNHLVHRRGKDLDVLGITSTSALEHASDLFDSLKPRKEEEAALHVAEAVSDVPALGSSLIEKISDELQLASQRAEEVIAQSADIGFVDWEDASPGDRLLFNGNIFRRAETQKVQAVLASLSGEEEGRIRELDQLLRIEGCVELRKAQKILGGRANFEKLHAIGLYDVNAVENPSENVSFVSRPAAFGKYGNPFVEDAFDLAKALVVCLKYGMTRSAPSRGRIMRLDLLLQKLIDGHSVGPATAIGEDYRWLELRRVVQIRRSGDLYSMKLLKREIGEIALLVLTQGDASEQSLENLPSAAAVRYAPPETQRELVRKRQTEPSKRASLDLLYALRTGGR